jgi:predicted PurR-regulated permease PerM
MAALASDSLDSGALWKGWPLARVAVGTLVVSMTGLAFLSVYLLWKVLLCLFIGIVLDTAVRPFTDALSRFVPRFVAVAGVYAMIVAILTAMVVVGIPAFLVQAENLLSSLPDIYQRLRSPWLETPDSAMGRVVARFPESAPALSLTDVLNFGIRFGSPDGMGLAESFLRSGLAVIAVVLSAFYWSLQGPRTTAALLLWAPEPRREAARGLVEEMQQKVGDFIRGQGILCLFVGGISLVAFWLIGLPYPVVLAALSGVLEIVPYFGPVLAVIPAALVAISTDPTLLIGVVIAAGVVQFIENNFLVPRIMGRSVGVHPVVTLLAIAGFGSLMGVAGVILAIPLAAIVQLLLRKFVLEKAALEAAPPAGRDLASRLRYEVQELVQDVRSQLRQKPETSTGQSDQIEDSIESLATDLEQLLAGSEAAPSLATIRTDGAL